MTCPKDEARDLLRQAIESMTATHYTLGVIRPALEKIEGPNWEAIFDGLNEERAYLDDAYAALSKPCQHEAKEPKMKLLSAVLDVVLLPVAVAQDLVCPWPTIVDGKDSNTRKQIEKIEAHLGME